ncbi:hypothetical protein Tco_0770615 [Tanacetum coccineum]|uniref:Uncharacterized protein n=1 Tax=Tanacetum coccineum TaxID=301880 RepID=A0ABQ4ZCP8_9ASTR
MLLVRRMINEPGGPDREVPVAETFYKQNDDELTEKEVKQMKADDQAIRIILMGLPKDIYAVVDSCETVQEIWLRAEVNELRAERLARAHDPLALMTSSNNPYNYPVFHQDQPSLVTYMQIAQPGINLGQDRQMQMVRGCSKLGLQSITSGQISSELDLTYAPSTITTQKPTEHELDLLFEAMYDDYIGGQPSAATRTISAAQAPEVLQTPTTSTTIADTAPTPTNSSSQAANILNTS